MTSRGTEQTAWVVLWKENNLSRRTDHVNIRSARQKCKDMSVKFGLSQYAQVFNSKVTHKWTFEAGKETDSVQGSGEHVSPQHEDPVQKAMEEEGIETPKPKRLRKVAAKAAVEETKKAAAKAGEPTPQIIKKPKKVVTVDAEAVHAPTTKEQIAESAKRISVPRNFDAVVASFEAREGTLRMKLIVILAQNLDKPVSVIDIQKSLYGEYRPSFTGALKMVIKGMRVMIAKNKLPFVIVDGKISGELSYMLSSQ